MNKVIISKRLYALRKLKGLTQEQLSNDSGVALRTIQRIEAGSVSSHLQTLSLLSKALNVEVSELAEIQAPSSNEPMRNWLLFLHISPILGSIFPCGNLFLPIALWLFKRKDSIEVDSHGRSVVNFQLTMMVIHLVCLLLIITHAWSPSIYVFLGSIIFNLGLVLFNSFRIWKSKTYDFILSIPFLRPSKEAYM
jgi:D-alanyl-D-alanine-carboxypeptidase/D-alanyl-D-alanine-endopeptidase